MQPVSLSIEHINNFKSKLGFKSEPTQETYYIFVNQFLNYTKRDISKQALISFLSSISKNSIHTAFYALKFFYDSSNLPFELKIGDIVPKGNIRRTKEILTPQEIEAIVKTTKEFYGIIEIGYIAVSTVYAARRTEIYNITHKNINEDITKLTIFGLKGSDERTHIIPEQIKEPIKDFRFILSKIKKKPPVTSLNTVFDHICDRAGVTLRPRLGFHSIRRAFVSELMLTDLNATIIRHFMRWRARESDIILNYDIKNPERVDQLIFEKHPFLKFWES